ncbi:MAG: hypothetical protein OCC46_13920 [Pseudodesulfovibrio sp.]
MSTDVLMVRLKWEQCMTLIRKGAPTMKTRIILTLTFILVATSAFAWDRGDHIERYYDHKGDKIAQQYDARGDQINDYYDRMALEAALRGNFGQALMLDAKGDRLDAEMDAKGEYINRMLDKKGRKIDRSMDSHAVKRSAHLTRRWRHYR